MTANDCAKSLVKDLNLIVKVIGQLRSSAPSNGPLSFRPLSSSRSRVGFSNRSKPIGDAAFASREKPRLKWVRHAPFDGS